MSPNALNLLKSLLKAKGDDHSLSVHECQLHTIFYYLSRYKNREEGYGICANQFCKGIQHCDTGQKDGITRFFFSSSIIEDRCVLSLNSQAFVLECAVGKYLTTLENKIVSNIEKLLNTNEVISALLPGKYLLNESHQAMYIRSILGHHFGLDKALLLDTIPSVVEESLLWMGKEEMINTLVDILPSAEQIIKEVQEDVKVMLNSQKGSNDGFSIDLINYLGGNPDEIYLQTQEKDDGSDDEEYTLTFEGAKKLLMKRGLIADNSN